MNEHLYGVCARLPDALRRADMKAYFRSVHGTLNHLLLVDRLWLARFDGVDALYASLAQELQPDFDALRQARRHTDWALSDWVEGVAESALYDRLTYSSMVTRRRQSVLLCHALLHLFHHQTHHRGQLTTLLTQLGVDFGETDLIWMPGLEA